MGHRARARVLSLYDWPVIIAQWQLLWEELARIARSLKLEDGDRLDYLQPNYFSHFSHYASRIVDDTVPVQLTPRGEDVLAGRMPLLLHPWAPAFLHLEHLRATLAALRPTRRLGAALLLGDLARLLHKEHGLSRCSTLLHLMWLAKYDLVSLDSAES